MKVKVMMGVLGTAAAVSGWLLLRAPSRKFSSESRPTAAQGSRGQVTPDAAEVAKVKALVDARNRLEPREEEQFRARGWNMVAVPPPDGRLVALDPRLLEGREAELRTQLLSAMPAPGSAANVVAIARGTHSPETRFAAVEALGRMAGPDAQRGLYDLLLGWADGTVAADDPARRQTPALLRPSALDDPWAATLAHLLDDPRLSQSEKRQLAFTLALVGLRDGMTLPNDVLSTLSPEARALLGSMSQLARAGAAGSPSPAPGGAP